MMSFYIGISIIFTILGLFWISLCVRTGLPGPWTIGLRLKRLLNGRVR